MSRLPHLSAQRGFTLIEAIIVIVMIGALGAIVAVFIRAPIQSYADSVARAEVTDEADLALRRIARDLRLALPNSIRGGGSSVEFLMTKAGGRYLAADDGADGEVLDFQNPAPRFTVVNPLRDPVDPSRDLDRKIQPNVDYVVVYNLGPGMEPSDAYQANSGAGRNISRIVDVTPGPPFIITMADNPFATQAPPMPSPARRFQIVSGPVSYYCAAQPDGSLALWRQWGYPISAEPQAAPLAGARRALVASRLANCDIFKYDPATQRSALVVLTLELRARNASDTTVRLVHQVHVDNTP